MRFVVDASVVLKWFLKEKGSTHAREYLARFRAGYDELIAPAFEPSNDAWQQTLPPVMGNAAPFTKPGDRATCVYRKAGCAHDRPGSVK